MNLNRTLRYPWDISRNNNYLHFVPFELLIKAVSNKLKLICIISQAHTMFKLQRTNFSFAFQPKSKKGLHSSKAGCKKKLQNTLPLICMSLNKNSIYCVMLRSSKNADQRKQWWYRVAGYSAVAPKKINIRRLLKPPRCRIRYLHVDVFLLLFLKTTIHFVILSYLNFVIGPERFK